jgi:hypothetical protein
VQKIRSTSNDVVTATATTHAIMESMARRNKWECNVGRKREDAGGLLG